MIFSLFSARRRSPAPLLDTTVFDRVLQSGGIGACRRLATQLLAFADDPATPAYERELIMPYLARLATHPAREVRVHTAMKASECMNLAPDVAFCIIAEENDVALPFIRAAVCLDEKMQLAVFRAGDTARRCALCEREDLSPAVLAEVVEHGEREVVLACLRNDALSLSPAQARQLYVRFREDEEILAALLRRPDLPLEVRIAHVEIESGRLREVMARSDWQEAQRAATAAIDMEEQALVNILADSGDEERLRAALEFLARRGKLTASVVLRAACAGHVAVLVQALAWLARMRPARLQAALQPEASLGVVRTALARASLPASAHALVLGVMLAARHDGPRAAEVGYRIPAFGPLVLQAIAETDLLNVTEKMEAASMLQRVGDTTTRELAARFVQTLLRHAA